MQDNKLKKIKMNILNLLNNLKNFWRCMKMN